MKAVLLTDESRALPNDPDGLKKAWIFNGDNCSVGIPRQQSDSVLRIWGGMIRYEPTDLFCVPEELKLPAVNVYCSFLKKSIEAWHGNLLLAQLKNIISRDHLHVPSVKRTVFMTTAMHFRDRSMHKPLCLGVREGFLVILLIEAINPMV